MNYKSLATFLPILIMTSISQLSWGNSTQSRAEPARYELKPYVDLYYTYNFNEPFPINGLTPANVSGSTLPYGNNRLRFYDGYHNQFALNLVEFTFTRRQGMTHLLVDLDFGQAADLNARIISNNDRVEDEVSKNIGQAILTLTPQQTPGLRVAAGKMHSHVGFERPKARDNFQYSRSYMYSYGLPIWHSGLQVFYDFDENWKSGVFIYNGSNTLYDSNAGKSLGARLAFERETFLIRYNYIGGPEQDNDSSDQRHVHEAHLLWTPSINISFAVEAITGSEQNVMVAGLSRGLATWTGAAIYGFFKMSDTFDFSTRIETFKDEHGYTTGSAQTLNSFTLTSGIQLDHDLQTRLEARYDKSNLDTTFTRRAVNVPDQFTASIALLYFPEGLH